MSRTTCHEQIESIYSGSHKLLGLLVVAVGGLISSDPCIIAVGPYKSDDASGPSSAMVAWCEWDVVPLKVCVLVVTVSP
jgi:hypothetical protein